MDLPSFDEFWNSITPDRYDELCAQINGTEIFHLVDGATPENMEAFYNGMINFTVKAAFKLQLAFLAEYHEWLRDNL